ncbi:MAG: F0F1 ATP synthase subunit delta [Pseudomonadota bacterium]|nr:F0F1 ATP synthase subunit delta [Pseudomonadota bacterium]
MPQDIASPVIAGDSAILARRYAGALYDLAEEKKQLDTVAADLRVLRRIRLESPEFQLIANNPRLSRTHLVQAAQRTATAAGLSELTTKFLSLVARNRRLDVLGAVIDAFLAALAAKRGEFTAEVTAAQALSSEQEEQLAGKLGAWVGGKVHLSVSKDSALLGGLIVKMGSRLIDASVRTKLARLERQLKLEDITLQKGVA